MYEKFTDRSRKVMQFANQEAQRLNNDWLGVEHMLLGLIKEGSGVGANILKNLGLDLKRVRDAVEMVLPQSASTEQIVVQKLPHTPCAKAAVQYAIEEARSMGHDYVGTEHILLGLIRDSESSATNVLRSLGVEREEIRKDVLMLLGVETKDKDEGYTIKLVPLFRFNESLELERAYKATMPDGTDVMFQYHLEGSNAAMWRGRAGWAMDDGVPIDCEWHESMKEAVDSATANLKFKHANLIDKVATSYASYVADKVGV